MPNSDLIHIIGATLFAIAVLHTFSTSIFDRLASANPRHAGIWHLLGEVEVVFGFWAMVLVICIFAIAGKTEATGYLESRNFTEPMFVFAVMVIAGTRPVLQVSGQLVALLARLLPLPKVLALYFLTLSVVPLLGSLITEPAAMTLAALMLKELLYTRAASERLKYATLGVLFVNVSIGGTLTSYAAPPVLMVAGTWQWDTMFMLSTFGWRAAIAVAVNAALVALVFRGELLQLGDGAGAAVTPKVPAALIAIHLGFLAFVVIFAHHPVVFMGAFLFFLGVANAYGRHQDPLVLKEALLVAFFLGGLVVLGGQQQWWLEPLLLGMSSDAVYYGATALTAITDNAALTYLGSLVDGLTLDFKTALVAGAVTGGGLTIIANAPNPAGAAILKDGFTDSSIRPLGLLLGALPPTLVAVLAFRLL